MPNRKKAILVNSSGKHNAIVITIVLLLLTGVLAALLIIPGLGTSVSEGAFTSTSLWATTTETGSQQVEDDPEPADVSAEVAFGIVRESSVNDDSLSAADDFLNGQMRVGRYGVHSVREGVDWSGGEESRSYLRLLMDITF